MSTHERKSRVCERELSSSVSTCELRGSTNASALEYLAIHERASVKLQVICTVEPFFAICTCEAVVRTHGLDSEWAW